MPDSYFSDDKSDMNRPLSKTTPRERNGDGSRHQAALQKEAFEDDDLPDDAFLEAGMFVVVLQLNSTNCTLSSRL